MQLTGIDGRALTASHGVSELRLWGDKEKKRDVKVKSFFFKGKKKKRLTV